MLENILQNRKFRIASLIVALTIFVFLITQAFGRGYRIHHIPVLVLALFVLILATCPLHLVRGYKAAAVILLNTILLLIAIESIATAGLWLYQKVENNTEHTSAYLDNQPWSEGYLNEKNLGENVGYEPFVIWKTLPHKGQYINIDQSGNRVTPGAICEKNSYVVFVFGGSTIWGDGVPDWATIPAYLQRELTTRRKEPVCVRNFGQRGWVSTQSVIELLRHLQTDDLPNLVVFYDGINDVSTTLEGGVAGSHDGAIRLRRRLDPRQGDHLLRELTVRTDTFRMLQRLSGTWDDQDDLESQPSTEQLGEAVARVYTTNYRVVQDWAKDYGFECVFFWQPSLHWGRKLMTSDEKNILDSVASYAENPTMSAAYLKVQEYSKTADHLFYIADIFQNTSAQMYLDTAHLTPEGNEMVAKVMVEHLIKLNQN